MLDDRSKQNYREKTPHPSKVASEASTHRQKIASLRSSFLTRNVDQTRGPILTGSSASPSLITNSLTSDELQARSQDLYLGNGYRPYLQSDSLLYNQPEPVALPRASRYPRRVPRIASSRLDNNAAFSPTRYTGLSQHRISEPHALRYSTEKNCPTIVYETLAAVQDVNMAPIHAPRPGIHNSAMFYQRSVMEPKSAALSLSPSEPLCLYAAGLGGLCQSCQRLAISGTSSFHRSSSRHSQFHRDSSEESFVASTNRRHRGRSRKLHGSLLMGYRSVSDLKRQSRRRTLGTPSSNSSTSSTSSSPSLNLRMMESLSSDEFWPIAVSTEAQRSPYRRRIRQRRRTRSLNPRQQLQRQRRGQRAAMSNSSTTEAQSFKRELEEDEEEARAVDALAMRLQPMLEEGRVAEVQTILLKALTQPEMRQRALNLLDYLTSEGAIFTTQNRQQEPGVSRRNEPPSQHQDAAAATDFAASDLSSSTDLSQTFTSRLKISSSHRDATTSTTTVNNNNREDAATSTGEEEEEDEVTEAAAAPSQQADEGGGAEALPIVKVMLPPGGVVEPPPPRLPMPPPKPVPPPSPRSAVVPKPEDLAKIDDYVINMLDVNPLLITDLVAQLTKDCSSDVEVVRRLFRWVTAKNFDLVEYDAAAPSDSFVGMLRNVQMGSLSRNELFHELCRFAGIYCQYISGYSKGAGYRPGMSLKQGDIFRNTWLAVYAAGGWRFVNCNWAARYATSTWNSRSSTSNLSGSGSAVPKCDDFYFFTDPEQHIFEHWPDNKVWQLLQAKPISQARFVSLPVLKSAFFNAGLSLKKPYSHRLTTKNGKVSIKLRMPYFVGISCSLENCADGSFLRGFCLAEVLLNHQGRVGSAGGSGRTRGSPDVVRVQCAPSQPGRFYLNIYVSLDWRRDDIRELACSFQIQCFEFNYSRLVVMGRLPEVGFLGRTPAAANYGVVLLRGGNGTRPYILHTSSDPLKIPFFISPGLRVCHQLKSFDRPGHQMTDCDNYALLQMRPPTAASALLGFESPVVVVNGSSVATTATSTGPGAAAAGAAAVVSTSVLGWHHGNAHYHLRLPISAFYYLTVYAAFEDTKGTIATAEINDHLECVYRVLIDARRPTVTSGGADPADADGKLVPAFPRQTYWWVGAHLLEPTRLNLEVNKRHLFRIDVPAKFASVAVVINSSEWHFLKSNHSPTKSNDSSGNHAVVVADATSTTTTACIRWSGKVTPLVTGELAIYASTTPQAANNASSSSSEGVPYVKLLEYTIFQPPNLAFPTAKA